MIIKTRKDLLSFYTDIETTQLFNASRLVSSVTGIKPQPNKAVIGANAFAHEAGIHQDGVLKESPGMKSLRRDVRSTSIDDAKTRDAIKKAWDGHGLLLEPHGAVGWAALEGLVPENEGGTFYVSLETAHPAKFPDEIGDILGLEPELPESMKGLDKKQERFETIPAEYGALREFLRQMF